MDSLCLLAVRGVEPAQHPLQAAPDIASCDSPRLRGCQLQTLG